MYKRSYTVNNIDPQTINILFSYTNDWLLRINDLTTNTVSIQSVYKYNSLIASTPYN